MSESASDWRAKVAKGAEAIVAKIEALMTSQIFMGEMNEARAKKCHDHAVKFECDIRAKANSMQEYGSLIAGQLKNLTAQSQTGKFAAAAPDAGAFQQPGGGLGGAFGGGAGMAGFRGGAGMSGMGGMLGGGLGGAGMGGAGMGLGAGPAVIGAAGQHTQAPSAYATLAAMDPDQAEQPSWARADIRFKPAVWDTAKENPGGHRLDREKDWPLVEIEMMMYGLGDRRDVLKPSADWMSQEVEQWLTDLVQASNRIAAGRGTLQHFNMLMPDKVLAYQKHKSFRKAAEDEYENLDEGIPEGDGTKSDDEDDEEDDLDQADLDQGLGGGQGTEAGGLQQGRNSTAEHILNPERMQNAYNRGKAMDDTVDYLDFVRCREMSLAGKKKKFKFKDWMGLVSTNNKLIDLVGFFAWDHMGAILEQALRDRGITDGINEGSAFEVAELVAARSKLDCGYDKDFDPATLIVPKKRPGEGDGPGGKKAKLGPLGIAKLKNVDSLKLNDVKAELKARGIKAIGKKDVMVELLRTELQKEAKER